MKIYAATQKGPAKGENEDRILAGTTIISDGFFCGDLASGIVAIADGVGGNNAGAVASQMVCEMLSSVVVPTPDRLLELNRALIERGRSNPALQGMATTLTGIFLSESQQPFLFHVGNTRVYAIRANGYLRQLTEDDTVVQYLVKAGKLSAEEAESYPARNEITSCMGGGKEELFQLKTAELARPFGKYLLTSDGVHEALILDDIEGIIADSNCSWATAVSTLISSARENGSSDDCSAVIIELDAM